MRRFEKVRRYAIYGAVLSSVKLASFGGPEWSARAAEGSPFQRDEARDECRALEGMTPSVTAQSGGAFAGRVVSGDTGESVGAAIVEATVAGVTRATRSDQMGAFTLTGLVEGRYVLAIRRTGFLDGRHVLVVESAKVSTLPANSALLTLQRAAVIDGQLTDDSEVPLAGVAVRASRIVIGPDGAEQFGSAHVASTDDRGAFRLFGLSAGRYVVSAVVPLNVTADVRGSSGSRRSRAVGRSSSGWQLLPVPTAATHAAGR